MPYPVTQDFTDKMRAAERQTFGKVQIDYTDVFLDQSITAAANEQANASYSAQTADSLSTPFAKIASLDGSCKLDGTYALAPDPAEAATHQMGWWGKQLAGTGGVFATPYPALTVTHQLRPVHSLKVVGDSARAEYPVDFEVRLYAADNTLLKTETVTANTQVSWSKALSSPVLDVAKQILTITKWSHAGRQAKIVEFFTSIQETYEGADIISVSLLEEREVSQGSLPVGSISANELDARLDNSSRKFDAGNTSSPLRNLVKANRRIKAWLGVEAENMQSTRPATFSRESVAYNPETGASVANNVPRFVSGKHGKAVLVEEGVQNLVGSGWNPVTDNEHQTVTQTSETLFGQPIYHVVKKQQSTMPIDVYGPFTVPAGASFTATMYSKQYQPPVFSQMMLLFWKNGQGELTRTSSAIVGEWVRLQVTYTNNTGADVTDVAVYYYASGDAGEITDFGVPQVEQKPYATSPMPKGATRAGECPNIPTAGVLSPSGGTWEQWVYIDGVARRQQASTWPTVFCIAASGNYGMWLYHLHNVAAWQMEVQNAAQQSSTCWFSDSYTPDGWHFFAVTWTTTLLSIYVDGQLRATMVNPLLPATFGDIASFGTYYYGNHWLNTSHDDLRISSRARTDAEILAAYQSGEPLPVDEWTTYKLTFNGSIYPVEMCWVPLGTFWSLDWDSPDDRLEVTVTARDRLELLRKGTFQTSQVQTNVSLYTLAEQVLQSAGLSAGEYVIDSALQSITVPYAWFDPVAPREALRRIAEAALAVVYADRDGKVRITSCAMSGGQSILTLTEDDYFSLSTPSKQESVANEIIVTTQPLRPAAAASEVYRSNSSVTVPAGQTVMVTAYYNQPPVIDAAASLDNPPAGVSLESTTYYGWGAKVVVKNVNGADQQATLAIIGKPLTVQNKERVTARDETSITENGILRYEFPSNALVQTSTQAQQIANTLLASAKDPRRDAAVDWRGNPALLLGERVTVKGQDYHVIRQELEWAGALRAKLSGRRVI